MPFDPMIRDFVCTKTTSVKESFPIQPRTECADYDMSVRFQLEKISGE